MRFWGCVVGQGFRYSEKWKKAKQGPQQGRGVCACVLG